MSTTLLVLSLVALTLLALGASAYLSQRYNSLVSLRHDVDRAWANVDVLLKQRYDEVHRLADAVRAAGDASALVTEIASRLGEVEAEAGGAGAARFDAERQIAASAARLLDLAALDPALRTDDRLQRVQERITALEEQIRHRREYYNQIVAISNARREQFPDRLVAARAGLSTLPLFRAAGEARFDLAAVSDGGTPRVQTALPVQGRGRPG